MLTEAELALIKPHLSEENVKKLTGENGIELLTAQMTALSLLSIEQAKLLEKAEVVSLDRLEIDPDTLEMSVELTETKLAGLVESGAITPAVQKALSLALVGPENKRNVLALSRKASGGAKPFATIILDALKENKPVKIGEKTASQQKVHELSREGDTDKEMENVTAVMVQGANRGRK